MQVSQNSAFYFQFVRLNPVSMELLKVTEMEIHNREWAVILRKENMICHERSAEISSQLS